MNTLKEIFILYGVSVKDAAKAGIPYCSVWQQWTGRRPVGPKSALRYEELLKIPRWEFRPDLWQPPQKTEGEVKA